MGTTSRPVRTFYIDTLSSFQFSVSQVWIASKLGTAIEVMGVQESQDVFGERLLEDRINKLCSFNILQAAV